MKAKILLVATGSVAVIKTHKIFNRLKPHFNVRVIATPYVQKNYSLNLPLNKEKLSLTSFPQHIKDAKWADLIVVAPASANTLAKFASGIADNQVLATLLAARAQILFAPAMNSFMYKALQKRNILSKVARLGHFIIGPNKGPLWEGESGIGRMSEPAEITSAIDNYFKKPKGKALIVNKASRVEIDPVRYITTKASGQTGKLLATELAFNGYNVETIDVTHYSSQALVEEIKKRDFDIYFSPAAINDFWVPKQSTKIKKQARLTIELAKALDVVSEVTKLNKQVVTFKNDNLKHNAIRKLAATKSIFTVWTKLGAMGNDFVSGAIIFPNNSEVPFVNITKDVLAKMIVQALESVTKK